MKLTNLFELSVSEIEDLRACVTYARRELVFQPDKDRIDALLDRLGEMSKTLRAPISMVLNQ